MKRLIVRTGAGVHAWCKGQLPAGRYERHRRKITNPRFDAMLKLFVDGRIEPVCYVARPYGKTTILVTVSPIRIDGEFVGLSQLVQLKDEVQELFARFDATGRESFEREMLPNGYPGTRPTIEPGVPTGVANDCTG